jgi:hypothetical protein
MNKGLVANVRIAFSFKNVIHIQTPNSNQIIIIRKKVKRNEALKLHSQKRFFLLPPQTEISVSKPHERPIC